jgi:SNF2 family DNA or RNA helicase
VATFEKYPVKKLALSEYPFKMPPLAHQQACLDRFAHWEYAGFLMDMGCGKTKTLIDNAGWLYLNNQIEALLVVAPKGVYLNWVNEEVPKHMSDSVPYIMAYWSAAPRKFERDNLETVLKMKYDGLRILVVNVESLIGKKAKEFVDTFLKKYKALFVIDESTTIKSIDAARTDVCIKLGRKAAYRRILTGNIMPNGPLDIFPQAEFLSPGLLGHRSFYGFRNSVCVFQDQFAGNTQYKAVVGFRDLDKVTESLHKFSYIIRKEDCLDLPPKIYSAVDIEMGPKQAKAYADMLNNAVVTLENAEQVTATMVMTQLVRLHQITCGFLKTDTGLQIGFDETNHRLDQLISDLRQVRRKAIVWCNHRFNIEQVEDAITRAFGKDSLVKFDGTVGQDDREKAKVFYQDPTSPVRFFLANPAAGQFGITLTQADTCIYYSNSYNLQHRLQSEDRAHRIGQDVSVLYIDYQVRGTVDEKVIARLKAKKTLSDAVLVSNWREILAA